MVQETVVIQNPTGLHARPAASFLKVVKQFPCQTTLIRGEEIINARSMIALMSAGIECGQKVRIVCDGEREREALEALKAAVASGLGEKS